MARKARVNVYPGESPEDQGHDLPPESKITTAPETYSVTDENQSGDAELGYHRRRQGEGLPIKPISIIIIPHPEDEKLVLHGRRQDNGKWSYPGGHAEPFESEVEAAKRELREETGIDAEDFKLLGKKNVSKEDCILAISMFKTACPPDWVEISAKKDPDAEFSEFAFLDPSKIADEERHIPKEDDVIFKVKGVWGQSLVDLTTERQAILKESINQDPVLNRATVDSISDSYENENQFEDADLKLGEPYENLHSPAGEEELEWNMEQFAKEEVIEAATVYDAIGITEKHENERADVRENLEDSAIRRPRS